MLASSFHLFVRPPSLPLYCRGALLALLFVLISSALLASPENNPITVSDRLRQVVEFDIPSGAAIDSLKRFAAQASVQLLYSADNIEGIVTNAVKGGFTKQQAIDRMLAGTHLRAVEDEKTGAYAIVTDLPPSNSRAGKNPTSPPDEKQTDMKHSKKSITHWLAAMFVAGQAASGQSQPEKQATANTEQQPVVHLSPFTVHEEKANDYAATQATSTTRIAQQIQDLPQSVSVVTAAVLSDTGSFRIADSAGYVTPVGDPGALEGGDRYSLRGFFISRRFVDGVTVSGVDGYNMASDETNIERLEIIKGPNSILVPGGSPGGQINIVTKSPQFRDATTLTYAYSQYLNNEVSADVNRVFSGGKAAARLVLSGWDIDSGYYDNYFKHGWLAAPSFTYAWGDQSQITVKLESFHSKEAQLSNAMPLDQSQAPDAGYLREAPFVPSRFQFGGKDFFRERWETRFLTELDSKISSYVNMRLWLMADTATRNDKGPGSSGADPSFSSNNYNPLTGKYTPFTSFSYNPLTKAVTTTAVPLITVFPRTDQENLIKFQEVHLKNDYVIELPVTSDVKSTTVAGTAMNYSRVSWNHLTATNPTAVDFKNLAATGTYNPRQTVSDLSISKTSAQTDAQLFVYEQVSALENRLMVTAGVSRFWGRLERLDDGNLPVTAGVNPYSITAKTTDTNFGVVYKPVKAISLFAGYNRVGGGLPSNILGGMVAANSVTQIGNQKEAGVKGTLLDGKVTFSAAVFDIKQSNFATPNPAFLYDATQPTFLYYDVRSKGVEFEALASPTKELTIMGNFSHNRARTSFGVPFFGPDNIGALFGRYVFQEGPAKGLEGTLGIKYASKTPQNFVGGLTEAGVPYQPRGYLAPTTIVQAGIGYSWDTWKVRLLVNNLTNRHYLTNYGPALPRSFVAQLTKKF